MKISIHLIAARIGSFKCPDWSAFVSAPTDSASLAVPESAPWTATVQHSGAESPKWFTSAVQEAAECLADILTVSNFHNSWANVILDR